MDAHPGLAIIIGAVDIGGKIVVAVVVEGDIAPAGEVAGRAYPADPGVSGGIGHIIFHVPPVGASILCNLYVSIVGADPYNGRLDGRFGYGHDGAVVFASCYASGESTTLAGIAPRRGVGSQVG